MAIRSVFVRALLFPALPFLAFLLSPFILCLRFHSASVVSTVDRAWPLLLPRWVLFKYNSIQLIFEHWLYLTGSSGFATLPDKEQWISDNGVHLPGPAPTARHTATVYGCSLSSHGESVRWKHFRFEVMTYDKRNYQTRDLTAIILSCKKPRDHHDPNSHPTPTIYIEIAISLNNISQYYILYTYLNTIYIPGIPFIPMKPGRPCMPFSPV